MSSTAALRVCLFALGAATLLGLVAAGQWYGLTLPARAAHSAGEHSAQVVLPKAVWAPSSPILVRATGRGLYWHFQFAGPDQRFGTADDLRVDQTVHLPIDSDIRVSVESRDFVYSFSAPALKLRQIAVPELTYPLDFRTHRTGHFPLIADPLCGVRVFHEGDMGRIVVETRTEFETWYLDLVLARHSRKSST